MADLVRVQEEAPVTRPEPRQVVAEVKEQAEVMMDLVEQKKLYQVIAGKKFLQCEAWQLLASFAGLTPVIVWTRRVEVNGVGGWEARCEVYDQQGRLVAAGEAMCMEDEKNWRGKPQYQLRSMAQTRAVSKALRTKLSFVAVLAGYEPTPAEEMEPEPEQEPEPEVQERVEEETQQQEEEKEEKDPNELLHIDDVIEKFEERFGMAKTQVAFARFGIKPSVNLKLPRSKWLEVWRWLEKAEKAVKNNAKEEGNNG